MPGIDGGSRVASTNSTLTVRAAFFFSSSMVSVATMRPARTSPIRSHVLSTSSSRCDDRKTVVDGPFAETKELIAGFWILQVKSLDEAVAWMKRSPFREGTIEIRQVFETEDFGDALPADVREAEERMREQLADKQ